MSSPDGTGPSWLCKGDHLLVLDLLRGSRKVSTVGKSNGQKVRMERRERRDRLEFFSSDGREGSPGIGILVFFMVSAFSLSLTFEFFPLPFTVKSVYVCVCLRA